MGMKQTDRQTDRQTDGQTGGSQRSHSGGRRHDKIETKAKKQRSISREPVRVLDDGALMKRAFVGRMSANWPRVCPGVQFYTKCAVPVLICAVLTVHLCSYSLQQCDATPQTFLWELTALYQTFWLDFGERKGRGKGGESGSEGKEKTKGEERKGKRSERQKGREEKRRQREGREEERKGKKKN